MRSSGVMRGVTASSSTAGLNDDRGRAARRRREVRDLRALRDHRLLLVGGDHARARDHLAAVVGFERGELDVHEVAAAEVEDRQRELAGRADHRQVHVELLGLRADRDRARRRVRHREQQVLGRAAGVGERRRAARDRVVGQRACTVSTRGAGDADVVVARVERRLRAEARAELAAPLVVGDHDARLDQHLAHRDVELQDQAAGLLEAPAGVLHEERVGALVDRGAAALGQDRAGPCRRAASSGPRPWRRRARTTRCAPARGRRPRPAPRARASPWRRARRSGAISTTLPFLRFDRPLACRMMSSAWSQGTSFRRSVRLPPTVSLVMMFRPVKSAITCSTARTSTFWKLSESFSPA